MTATREPTSDGAADVAVRDRRLAGPDGFTLIELIMVLLILGVVAGIVILAVDPFFEMAESQRDATARAQQGLDCAPEEGPPPPGCDPAGTAAELPTPPAAGSLDVQVSPRIATTGTAIVITVTVLDEDGDGFDAEVRLEVTGSNTLEADARTDGDGRATFEYAGTAAGLDEAVACTGSNGRLPDSCAAVDGPHGEGHVAWMDPPLLVSATQTHDEDPGNRAVLRWNGVVEPAGNVDGYQVYDSSGCDAPPSAVGSARTRFDDGLLHIVFDEPWDADESRWLRVVEGTELNPFGVANLDSDCIEVGTGPDLAVPTIDGATSTHAEGDGNEVVIHWSHAVRLASGADVGHYRLFDEEASCLDIDGIPTGHGETRTAFGGAQLRIAFDEAWDADDPRWLRVGEETEWTVFGVTNPDGDCIEVGTDADPDAPTLDEAVQAHPLDSGAEVLVTWGLATEPVDGAGPEDYRLFDSAATCGADTDGGETAAGTERTQLGGTLLRITFDATWDAGELRWLRVSEDAEGSAFRTTNGLTECVEVAQP